MMERVTAKLAKKNAREILRPLERQCLIERFLACDVANDEKCDCGQCILEESIMIGRRAAVNVDKNSELIKPGFLPTLNLLNAIVTVGVSNTIPILCFTAVISFSHVHMNLSASQTDKDSDAKLTEHENQTDISAEQIAQAIPRTLDFPILKPSVPVPFAMAPPTLLGATPPPSTTSVTQPSGPKTNGVVSPPSSSPPPTLPLQPPTFLQAVPAGNP